MLEDLKKNKPTTDNKNAFKVTVQEKILCFM